MANKPSIFPPKYALRFFRWFCHPDFVEDIEGDLMERFEKRTKEHKAARWLFILDVLRLFRPELIKDSKLKIYHMDIFKNHLRVAIRSNLKHRLYALINLFGLSISIAFVFLSVLFIRHELSYDHFHNKKNELFRVFSYQVDPNTGDKLDASNDGVTAPALGPDLKSAVPSIQEITRIGSNPGTVSVENIHYDESITMVDDAFFDMFDFGITAGTSGWEDQEASVLLTREKAQKFFRDADPIGQSLVIILNDSARTFYVKGIIENEQSRSSISFDILVPFETMGMVIPQEWLTGYNASFVETWAYIPTPSQDLTATLSSVFQSKLDSDTEWKIGIQPLTTVHFDTLITGLASYTNPQKLWSMAVLVGLVLFIAIINFIALTTGHSFNRIKEIGLRKTLGTHRATLRYQLILESFVFTLVAGVIGIVISYVLLPSFNQLIEATIPGSFILSNSGLVILLSFLVGSITGLAQAALLIKVKPIEAMNGNTAFSNKESWLNQGLIVLQFSISILLIVGTLAIRSQMNFIQNKDLGFEKDRMIEIKTQSPASLDDAERLHQRYKTAALKNPSILDVGASMNSFQEPWTQLGFTPETGDQEFIHFNLVDHSYLEAIKIELVKGKGFNSDEQQTHALLVNEALVRYYQWEDPLNEQLPGQFETPHKIIGVIKDFHFSSLHNKIEPLILAVDVNAVITGVTGLSTYTWPPNLNQLIVRIGSGNLSESVAFLEDTWKETNPGKPFSFEFVDESIAMAYAEEAKWQKLINVASIFAIIIAMLGLIGLMRIALHKRVKEIGIRKALGSTALNISLLLSKRFLILIGIANLVAWPLAWWGVSQWLEGFMYRIEMSVWLLLLGGVVVLAVVVCVLAIQSRKASLINPIKYLRTE